MALDLTEGVTIGMKLFALVQNAVSMANALPPETKKIVLILTVIKHVVPPLCDLILEAVTEAED